MIKLGVTDSKRSSIFQRIEIQRDEAPMLYKAILLLHKELTLTGHFPAQSINILQDPYITNITP